MAITTTDPVVDRMAWLDSAAATLERAVEPIAGETASPALKDALVGTWLGHPLHPAVVLLPVGYWSSVVVLDFVGHDEAADLMIGAGLVASVAAAATGAAQWTDTTSLERPRRLGALHAMLNTAAAGLYGASLIARKRGNRRHGKLFSMAGYAVLNASGYIGGELSYEHGIGVSRNAFEQRPDEWVDAIAESELTEGKPTRVDVQGVPVLLLRHSDGIHAIGAICSHLGGPLDEGEIHGEHVVCPWHGSAFCVKDGAVERGPATAPAPAYEVRNVAGQVQIRAMR